MGVIKKDIILTGDVLNTTDRIQGLCNSYGVDILISNHLREKITPGPEFQFEEMGSSALKGKDERMALFTVSNIG